MLKLSNKKFLIIAAILMAVIFISLSIWFYLQTKNTSIELENATLSLENTESGLRHPLSGHKISANQFDFFPVSVMIDNGYDISYFAGLDQAHIVYEALVEANITRILAIFDSQTEIEKIGPVRSARNYFMDWAQEYQGAYLHVGGSPQALAVIDDYNFTHIDQIGSGQIYFERDENLDAPHNVFTSSKHISRLKEWKQIATTSVDFLPWNFVDIKDNDLSDPPNFIVNFSSENYQVEWKYSQSLRVYQRWRNQEKQISDKGEQLKADNVIIQIAPSTLIDSERRAIDTKSGGELIVYNRLGKNTGTWEKNGQRTEFFDSNHQPMALVPGQTWIAVVDSAEKILE